MSKYDDMIEELRAYLETEEGKQSIIDFNNERKLEEDIRISQSQKIKRYIDTLSEEEFHHKFTEFLKREKEYKFGWDESESIIFSRLILLIKNEGKKMKISEYDKDFLSLKYKWKGYTFLFFQSNSWFWRIKKGNKIIYQQHIC